MAHAAEVHRAIWEAFDTKDWDRIRELYDEDVEYLDAAGQHLKGREEAIQVAETYFKAFPDIRFEVRARHEVSDTVSVMELTGRGTHTGPLNDIAPTNQRVEVLLCNIVECRDGRVVREHEYFDTMSMLTQMGVVPG